MINIQKNSNGSMYIYVPRILREKYILDKGDKLAIISIDDDCFTLKIVKKQQNTGDKNSLDTE